MGGTATSTYVVHTHRSDDDADEEGEAREGGDLGKDKELIGRGGYYTVDVAGRRYMGGSKGSL